MVYKNAKTGAVIETTSEVHGDNWQALLPASSVKPKKETKVAPVQPSKGTRRKR